MRQKNRTRGDRRSAADRQAGEGAGPGRTEKTQDRGRSVAEWTSLGISLAILLGLVGLVSYQYFAGGSRPATIEVRPRLDALRPEGEAYYLPVSITNRGDLTAEHVRVRVSLPSDQGQQESSELNIQFLAGGATAHGTVVFREDPSRGRLVVEILSFLEP